MKFLFVFSHGNRESFQSHVRMFEMNVRGHSRDSMGDYIGSTCRKAAGYICSLGMGQNSRNWSDKAMPKMIFGSTSPFRWSTISNCWLSHPMRIGCFLKPHKFLNKKLSTNNCWFNRETPLIFPFFFWARNPSTSSPCFSRRASCKSWSLTIQAPHRWRITGCIPAIV